ncbi:MAG: hypothetical protein IRZ09_05155 [Variibacter sp.]|nr:hypothetical protein [Variibacter sp.]
MTHRRALPWIVAAALASQAAAAQQPPFGPPIDPNQVFQAQPRPAPPPPPPSAAAPSGAVGPPPPGEVAGDRVVRCHHLAAVERVPPRKRGSYIHNCMQAK